MSEPPQTVLLVGASRGLGHAMAAEFVARGWRVIGTVRGQAPTDLHALAKAYPGRVEIEALDITEQDQISALRERLAGRALDVLFVNAGTANRDGMAPIGDVSADEFTRLMLTNVLGVMRAVDALQDLVGPAGLIGAMSSGQGSIANNTNGGREAYRASKAALNQCMRSFAARAGEGRAMVLMAPGWIRTGLGGPEAPFSMEETIPQLVGTLIGQLGAPGLRYLDRFGQTVPW